MSRIANKKGYLLTEALLASVILAGGFLMVVNAGMKGREAVKYHANYAVATFLAKDLMEEIKSHRWDDNIASLNGPINLSAASTIGIDGSENIADKRTFNDIDDYNGWQELNVPLDSSMNPMNAYRGYSRFVTVQYVDFPSGGGVLFVAGDGLGSVKTNFKMIQVKVQWLYQGQPRQITETFVSGNVYH